MPASALTFLLAGTLIQGLASDTTAVTQAALPATASTTSGVTPVAFDLDPPALAAPRPAAPPSSTLFSSPVEIHGFLSQGYLITSDNNYLARSKEGSFNFGEAGVNFNKVLTDRLSAGLQLFSQSLGDAGHFETRADWFQLNYRYADWFGLRAGRVKLPFGLYNDISDVDSARVPILLPQSIYPIQNRLQLAQSGGELYGYVKLGESAGALDYRAYAGALVLELNPPPGAPYTFGNISNPYITGARVLWETPLEGLRAGGSAQVLRVDADIFFPGVTDAVKLTIPAFLWVGSAEYVQGPFEAAAEYSRWRIRMHPSDSARFPASDNVSERMYGMASYRFADWLQIGGYYSRLVADVEHRAGTDALQHDAAATLRFDINTYWLLKLEGHYMAGTAGLDPQLNGNRPLGALVGRWGLFLLKTTVYF